MMFAVFSGKPFTFEFVNNRSRDAMWQGEPNQTPESQSVSTEDKDPPSQTLGKNLINSFV